MKYTQSPIFPVLIHEIITEPDPDLKLYCLQEAEKDPVGTFKTNEGGWQSQSTYRKSLISDKINEIMDSSIRKAMCGEIQLLDYWININGLGSSNNVHDHPGSDFAGVYYVQVPDNSGDIYFQNPHTFVGFREMMFYNPDMAENSGQILQKDFTPVAGLCLIFPSHLKHGVLKSGSTEDRISISFNIRVIG